MKEKANKTRQTMKGRRGRRFDGPGWLESCTVLHAFLVGHRVSFTLPTPKVDLISKKPALNQLKTEPSLSTCFNVDILHRAVKVALKCALLKWKLKQYFSITCSFRKRAPHDSLM